MTGADIERVAEALFEERRAKYKNWKDDWTQIDDLVRNDWRDTAKKAVRELHAIEAPRMHGLIAAATRGNLSDVERHALIVALFEAAAIHFTLAHHQTAELLDKAAAAISLPHSLSKPGLVTVDMTPDEFVAFSKFFVREKKL